MYMHTARSVSHSTLLFLVPLSIRLSSIVSVFDNQIFWSIIVSSREIRFKDILRTPCITCLSINRCARHVRNHGIPALHGILGIAKRVVFGCWLWEPDVASVATEVARLESLSNILLDNDGTAGGVDKP